MQRQRTSPWQLPWVDIAQQGPRWVAAWTAAQQRVEPDNRLRDEFARQSTLRQVVRLALGGHRFRVRVSNRFGDAPLVLHAAAAAPALAPGSAAIDATRAQALTFGGREGAVVAPGAEVVSDVLTLELAAGADLALSLALAEMPPQQTGHPGSRATSFVVAGSRAFAASWPHAEAVVHWYLIADVEAWCDHPAAAWVAIGDSITDGRGSTTDGNDRWPDLLRARLAAQPARPGGAVAVVHTALGGNRLLHDGIGPSVVSRFGRDVLQRAGAAAVLLHIGINDLGTRRQRYASGGGRAPLPASAREAFFAEMTQGWTTLAGQARAQGLAVIGATLTPFVGNETYAPDADDEADRQRLNAWLRASDAFDALADFDAALRDPDRPERARADLHCGDHLHPSPAGMAALAAAVPLPA